MKQILIILFILTPLFAFSQNRSGTQAGGGGSKEYADGNTIIGSGVAEDEFRVDTNLVATIGGVLDTLQVFRDTLSISGGNINDSEYVNVNASDIDLAGDIGDDFTANIFTSITDAAVSDYVITLPDPTIYTKYTEFYITNIDESDSYSYYIVADTAANLSRNNVRSATDKYYLDNQEEVRIGLVLDPAGNYWKIFNEVVKKDFTAFEKQGFVEGKYKGYSIQKVKPKSYEASVFAFPVKAKFERGENYFRASEPTNTNQLILVGEPDMVTDVARVMGPFGRQAIVYRLEDSSTSSSFWFRYYPTDANWFAGQQIAVSFFAMVIEDADDDISIRVANLNGSDNTDFDPGAEGIGWQRMETVLTVQSDYALSVEYIDFGLSGDIGDKIALTAFQVEKGAVSDYHYTSNNGRIASSDSLYYVADPINGVLYLDNIPNNLGYTDTEMLQAAIDYCYLREDCQEVFIEENKEINETIRLPENVSLRGNHPGKTSTADFNDDNAGTRLIVKMNDTMDGVIEMYNKAGTNRYVSNSHIRNLMFVANSEVDFIIDMKDAYGIYVENVTIQKDTVSATYPISKGITCTSSGLSPLQNTIRNVEIQNAEIGFDLGIMSLSELKTVAVLNSEIGLKTGVSSSLYVNNSWFEDLDSSAVISGGSQVYINDCYTENVVSADGIIFDISNASNFGLKGLRGNNTNGSGDITFLKLTDVDNAHIFGSRLVSNFDSVLQISGVQGAINFSNNTIEGVHAINGIDFKQTYGVTELEYNSNRTATGLKLENYSTFGYIEKSKLVNSEFLNAETDGNFIFRNDTITLQGVNNLIKYSDQLDQNDSPWNRFSGSVTVTANDTIGPDGVTVDAEKIVSNASPRLAQFSVSNVMEADQDYVLTFWVKPVGAQDGNEFLTVEFSPANETFDTVFFNSNDWTKVTLPFRSDETLTPGDALSFNFEAADSIYLTRVHLYEGLDENAPYVQTGSTITESTQVVFTGVPIFDEVQITDILKLTARSTEPTAVSGVMYFDDGTNTTSTNPAYRFYNGTVWVDLD